MPGFKMDFFVFPQKDFHFSTPLLFDLTLEAMLQRDLKMLLLLQLLIMMSRKEKYFQAWAAS